MRVEVERNIWNIQTKEDSTVYQTVEGVGGVEVTETGVLSIIDEDGVFVAAFTDWAAAFKVEEE